MPNPLAPFAPAPLAPVAPARPIRERVLFMKRNASAMLGFGAGLALMSLVPGAILLAIPAGVAGATRLVATIERSEGRRLLGTGQEV